MGVSVQLPTCASLRLRAASQRLAYPLPSSLAALRNHGVSFPALSSYLRPTSAKMEKQGAEKEVTGQINTVDMEEEKKDLEKVVLKVNYETEDEKKEIEAASPKLETKDTEAGAGGHICSPSIESCPSPVSEEKEAEDAESGSSMSTLSLPSSSNSEEDSSGSSSAQRVEEGVTDS